MALKNWRFVFSGIKAADVARLFFFNDKPVGEKRHVAEIRIGFIRLKQFSANSEIMQIKSPELMFFSVFEWLTYRAK